MVIYFSGKFTETILTDCSWQVENVLFWSLLSTIWSRTPTWWLESWRSWSQDCPMTRRDLAGWRTRRTGTRETPRTGGPSTTPAATWPRAPPTRTRPPPPTPPTTGTTTTPTTPLMSRWWPTRRVSPSTQLWGCLQRCSLLAKMENFWSNQEYAPSDSEIPIWLRQPSSSIHLV